MAVGPTWRILNSPHTINRSGPNLNDEPVSSSLGVKLFLASAAIADDVSVSEVDGCEVGGDIKPAVQLVGGHPAHVHQAAVHLVHGDDRLSASNITSLVKDEDDGVVLRMTVPRAKELLRAGAQQSPTSRLSIRLSTRLVPEAPEGCL